MNTKIVDVKRDLFLRDTPVNTLILKRYPCEHIIRTMYTKRSLRIRKETYGYEKNHVLKRHTSAWTLWLTKEQFIPKETCEWEIYGFDKRPVLQRQNLCGHLKTWKGPTCARKNLWIRDLRIWKETYDYEANLYVRLKTWKGPIYRTRDLWIRDLWIWKETYYCDTILWLP